MGCNGRNFQHLRILNRLDPEACRMPSRRPLGNDMRPPVSLGAKLAVAVQSIFTWARNSHGERLPMDPKV